MTVCACGSGLDFDDCCGPVLAGRPALTAESLMRSRYSAFVLRDLDYIQRSQGREVNQDFNRLEAERALEETEWQRLELLGVVQGGVDDDIGHVEFIIHHTRRGKPLTQHELASFCREDSVWLYYGG
ncbi:MAG: YchJ family metal-binding protein [Rhodospirillaceae bacterium]